LTNNSITGRQGLGDEFQQTNCVTGFLVAIAFLVVVSWITITHRRVSLESRNHQGEMSVKRSELYLNICPEKSADMRALDGGLLRPGISTYTTYENQMPITYL